MNRIAGLLPRGISFILIFQTICLIWAWTLPNTYEISGGNEWGLWSMFGYVTFSLILAGFLFFMPWINDIQERLNKLEECYDD